MLRDGGGGLRWVVGGGRRPLEATGDHRGQFLHSDVGPVLGNYFSNNTARTPNKLRLVGELYKPFLDRVGTRSDRYRDLIVTWNRSVLYRSSNMIK